jgi:predicted nuclease of predicted toxin-antitoxin system
MRVRVKVDEDLPGAAAQMLQSRGYEAISVIDQGMCGMKDRPLWLAVQAEHRFLITADKGFADIRFYPPGTHAGILLLRPDQAGIRPILELLERTLAAHDLEALQGSVAVATPRGVRIRRAKV